jgi:hypothetical protein
MRIKVHGGPADAQSPEVRALVGPWEIAFQVVEIKVDWSIGQAYEREERARHAPLESRGAPFFTLSFRNARTWSARRSVSTTSLSSSF